jgi:hypothetical protein
MAVMNRQRRTHQIVVRLETVLYRMMEEIAIE